MQIGSFGGNRGGFGFGPSVAVSGPMRGVIVLIIGVVFLIFGLALHHHVAAFKATAVQTSGTVVGDVRRYSSDRNGSGVTYAPTLNFTTKAGQKITFTSSVSTSSYKQVGSTMTVYYDPANPTDARTNLSLQSGISLALILAGALLLGGGAWTLKRSMG